MKYLKIIVISLFVVGLIFVSAVSIMASEHKKSFTEEIKSWGESQQEKVVDNQTNNIETEDIKVLINR